MNKFIWLLIALIVVLFSTNSKASFQLLPISPQNVNWSSLSSYTSGAVLVATSTGTNWSSIIDITGSNVGIGSVNPGFQLDVSGTIRASGFSGQSSGTLLCVKTGGGIGYCSGVVAGISCTCN